MLEEYRQHIIAKTLTKPVCKCEYKYWYKQFNRKRRIKDCIKVVEEEFSDQMTRDSIITFYRRKDIDDLTKFLVVMMWGNESDGNGRRDGRGPWRVGRMTEDLPFLCDLLVQIKERIGTYNTDILVEAYRKFKIPWCGPSFFSKYFYFVGKAMNIKKYPLIFDNRVATGLAKISAARGRANLLNMVSIQAQRKAEAYLQYINMVHGYAENLECDADQIEMFLFEHGTV